MIGQIGRPEAPPRVRLSGFMCNTAIKQKKNKANPPWICVGSVSAQLSASGSAGAKQSKKAEVCRCEAVCVLLLRARSSFPRTLIR